MLYGMFGDIFFTPYYVAEIHLALHPIPNTLPSFSQSSLDMYRRVYEAIKGIGALIDDGVAIWG